MCRVINLKAYINEISKELQNCKDINKVLENMIIQVNHLIAISLIYENSPATKEQKKLNNMLMETLSKFLSKEIKKEKPKLYYSIYGLKNFFECYHNDTFMELIGFRNYLNYEFNLIEYGKNS